MSLSSLIEGAKSEDVWFFIHCYSKIANIYAKVANIRFMSSFLFNCKFVLENSLKYKIL
jgi:hypothetical protein